MNLQQVLTVALSCIFFTQETAALAGWSNVENSGSLQSQSSTTTSSTQTTQSRDKAAEDERFQLRRQNFTSGRQLLLDKGVPFDPDELLHDRWSKELHNALNSMPEMHQVRYETAPLNGAYLADTLYLPEKVEITGHTVILTNYLVFEGKNPIIKGPFDVNLFPRQPIAVLGSTLPQAMQKKPGLLNVRFGSKPILPSFAVVRDLRQDWKHITVDTSGLPAQKQQRNRKSGPASRAISWAGWSPGNLAQDSCSTGCNVSGTTGNNGINGTPGGPGAFGLNEPNGTDGDCSDPAAGSNNGHRGVDGLGGRAGGNGGNGGHGGAGTNAGNINTMVQDGDFNEWSFIANGGPGGLGGEGGGGGLGGDGGRGGNGGNGVACSCNVGSGGGAGHGANGGSGGGGGDGGQGGPGGNGGTITVSLPAGSPGAITSNSGGISGLGGSGGIGGTGGLAGPAGTPGIGATACGQTGATGFSNFPGSTGSSGNSGNAGPNGPSGLNGPPTSITFRDPVVPPPPPAKCDTTSNSFVQAPPDPNCPPLLSSPDSPIIIDTDGQGFHLTSAPEGVRFDISGTGHSIQIGWTAPGSSNGFLAMDRNHNGVIDNGTELFGNFTQQPKSSTPNGFLALAEFDKPENGGNGDGIIDERDAVFQHLVIWIDANHDGISQPGELHPLLELGIYSISLNYTDSHRVDQFGNVFRFRAKINPSGSDNGSEAGRWAFDVFLTTTTK